MDKLISKYEEVNYHPDPTNDYDQELYQSRLFDKNAIREKEKGYNHFESYCMKCKSRIDCILRNIYENDFNFQRE